jgi:peroxiredoxin
MSDKKITIGKAVPDFQLDSTSGDKFTLSDYLGTSKVVLYFYSKDNTSG